MAKCKVLAPLLAATEWIQPKWRLATAFCLNVRRHRNDLWKVIPLVIGGAPFFRYNFKQVFVRAKGSKRAPPLAMMCEVQSQSDRVNAAAPNKRQNGARTLDRRRKFKIG